MKKLNKLFSIVGTISLAAFLTACGGTTENNEETDHADSESTAWNTILEEGTITVATSGTLYPTSYHSDETNELTGFEVEIIKELANRLQLEVTFVEMGIDGMLTSVNNGTVDVAINDIDINEERQEKFLFATPYKFSYGSAIVREDDLSGIETLEDLAGKKSAGAATTVYMDISREYGAEEVIYDNVTNEQYLRDVATGRTDVILNDFYLQSLAVQGFPDLGVIIHPNLFYFPNQQSIIMKKDQVEMQQAINQVIEEMLADGAITNISEQFFGGVDVSKEPDIDLQ